MRITKDYVFENCRVLLVPSSVWFFSKAMPCLPTIHYGLEKKIRIV